MSLEIRAGEILALVGENGAGKSTLMRMAARELQPDTGTIGGTESVSLVHQHFLLVSELTVAENLALGKSGFRYASKRTLEREAEAMIAGTGIDLQRVARRVSELSVGEKAKLELVKAISGNPSVLILDEPTSVLTSTETDELFAVMRRRAQSGTAVVLISHKLREVLAVAARIVVMRGGRVVAEREAAGTTLEELAEAMVPDAGRLAESRRSPATTESERLLQLRDLELFRGRITAVVGVAGNGQNELARELRHRLPDAGHIPEDRTRDGLVVEMTVAENLALRSKRWSAREAADHARRMIELYTIRAQGPDQRAGDLSGGNQQKVILARELDRRPGILVAAEPTRGLDIEATRFVHQQLRNAAATGAAILVITSDLDEAFALADVLHVINRGRLSAPMPPAEAASRVATLMAGAS